jgi:inorganic pyrophosphatase
MSESDDEGTVPVRIEIPQGSRNKYEYDKDRGEIVFDRMLYSSMHYPTDYGYVPETLARDDDPIDVLLLVWEPTFPGCLVDARPVGVFLMEDEKGPDEKLLCVPVSDPQWNHVDGLDDVPPHLLEEVEHFFDVYKDLEDKFVEVEGWEGRKRARSLLEDAKERYEG